MCLAAYFVNRLVLKSVWEDGFVHEHQNDLICIPFWVPMMLAAQRGLGLRDDLPPRTCELVIPLVFWSLVFEIILPSIDLLEGRFVADHLDVVYYTLGCPGAGAFWRSRYS